jgi:hypothetical protein
MVVVLGAAAVLTAATASAFLDLSGQRPMRIEGSWDHARSDEGFIGEVPLTADGRANRTFGVRSLQAYAPEEEGMAVLRPTGLQSRLLVRGTRAMVARLFGARADRRITIVATYQPASATLLLGAVEIAAPDDGAAGLPGLAPSPDGGA